jgi:glycine betaine/proline transport system substrate-binding protein
MHRQTSALIGLALLASVAASPAGAAEDASCKTVRMSDPGWTDITSTNAFAGVLLEGLGYSQNVQVLSVPITFQGLKSDMVDVFLGNWLPAQTAMVEPMVNEGSLEVLTQNLGGLRFTLAVPNYVAESGVKSFNDLAAHADKFDKKIYGIESGAAVNQNVLRMLESGDFGLGDWELVESSEQGMLSEVTRAVRNQDWIVFEAWEPHPMNTKYELIYLPGGDKYFGPNLGEASVRTVARKGFKEACPNLAKLFSQLRFTVEMENSLMALILDEGADPNQAAADYLKDHPDLLTSWLSGVTTTEGEDGLAAVKQELGL